MKVSLGKGEKYQNVSLCSSMPGSVIKMFMLTHNKVKLPPAKSAKLSAKTEPPRFGYLKLNDILSDIFQLPSLNLGFILSPSPPKT